MNTPPHPVPLRGAEVHGRLFVLHRAVRGRRVGSCVGSRCSSRRWPCWACSRLAPGRLFAMRRLSAARPIRCARPGRRAPLDRALAVARPNDEVQLASGDYQVGADPFCAGALHFSQIYAHGVIGDRGRGSSAARTPARCSRSRAGPRSATSRSSRRVAARPSSCTRSDCQPHRDRRQWHGVGAARVQAVNRCWTPAASRTRWRRSILCRATAPWSRT